MADEVDEGNELAAHYLNLALSKRRPEGPVPRGRCYYCEEPLLDGRRWCDAHCRDDWQRLTDKENTLERERLAEEQAEAELDDFDFDTNDDENKT